MTSTPPTLVNTPFADPEAQNIITQNFYAAIDAAAPYWHSAVDTSAVLAQTAVAATGDFWASLMSTPVGIVVVAVTIVWAMVKITSPRRVKRREEARRAHLEEVIFALREDVASLKRAQAEKIGSLISSVVALDKIGRQGRKNIVEHLDTVLRELAKVYERSGQMVLVKDVDMTKLNKRLERLETPSGSDVKGSNTIEQAAQKAGMGISKAAPKVPSALEKNQEPVRHIQV